MGVATSNGCDFYCNEFFISSFSGFRDHLLLHFLPRLTKKLTRRRTIISFPCRPQYPHWQWLSWQLNLRVGLVCHIYIYILELHFFFVFSFSLSLSRTLSFLSPITLALANYYYYYYYYYYNLRNRYVFIIIFKVGLPHLLMCTHSTRAGPSVCMHSIMWFDTPQDTVQLSSFIIHNS